jgi:hypothetical protein
MSRDLRERFMGHVQITNYCWNWKGGRYSNGYGAVCAIKRNGLSQKYGVVPSVIHGILHHKYWKEL